MSRPASTRSAPDRPAPDRPAPDRPACPATSAQRWIADVARELDTDDFDLAYRVCKAWLQTVFDRLPVGDATHFAAQLPDVLRGICHDSWRPTTIPAPYDTGRFRTRFARTAGIGVDDVRDAARAVSQVLDRHMSGHLCAAMDHLPADLRTVLEPRRVTASHAAMDN